MKTLVTLLILTPIQILFLGFVAKTMWGWFVVPIFGLPALTLWQAYGLTLIVALVNSPIDYPDKKDTKEEAYDKLLFKFMASFIHLAIGLGVGFVVKSLM